jgi:methyltransferase (TIGR00027 family)
MPDCKEVLVMTLLRTTIVVICCSIASGIEPGLPSKTSIWIATARAIGAKNPDPALRNPDHLAIKFVGPRERAVLADQYPMNALDLDFEEALKRIPAPVTSLVGRTKYVDAALVEALQDGAKQVVVLGAGLDTRGFRFQDQLKGVRFLELDYGPTQEYKKRRVLEIFGSLPAQIRYVPMDFTKDDLLTELRKAGYSERDKTFFLWEGVVMYIPEPAVRDTLRFIKEHSGKGSRVIFNYALASHPEVKSPTTSRYAKWGEPFIFGFPGESAVPFVENAGLKVLSDVSGWELMLKHATRADGTSNLGSVARFAKRTEQDLYAERRWLITQQILSNGVSTKAS